MCLSGVVSHEAASEREWTLAYNWDSDLTLRLNSELYLSDDNKGGEGPNNGMENVSEGESDES